MYVQNVYIKIGFKGQSLKSYFFHNIFQEVNLYDV